MPSLTTAPRPPTATLSGRAINDGIHEPISSFQTASISARLTEELKAKDTSAATVRTAPTALNTGPAPKKKPLTLNQLTELMTKHHLAADVDKLVELLSDLGVKLAKEEPAEATA